MSSLLRTVSEFIRNSTIGFPSFQIHLLQQKGCKFHKICSLFAYIRYTIPDINQGTCPNLLEYYIIQGLISSSFICYLLKWIFTLILQRYNIKKHLSRAWRISIPQNKKKGYPKKESSLSVSFSLEKETDKNRTMTNKRVYSYFKKPYTKQSSYFSKKASARPGVNNSHKDATVHPGAKMSL